MSTVATSKHTELHALLVCPDRALAQQFTLSTADLKSLNVVADVKDYPTPAALDQRVSQLRPDVALLDVGSDRTTAVALLSHLAAAHPRIPVVGLHGSGDPQIILQCLRCGAAEFLYAPFPQAEAEQALMRLVRRKELEGRHAPARGKIVAFVPAKGGSGATTIACNLAHMLSQLHRYRVLLADFDVSTGTISFAFKLNHTYSLLDALQHSHQLDESLWGSLVSGHGGFDILPAPEKPSSPLIELHRIHECLEYARAVYDCVVIDSDSASEKLSAAALNEADRVFVVANPELPTLFLARKTLALLEEIGFRNDQIGVLLNRVNRREELTLSDMEKIFRFPISATFPSDAAAVRRSLTEGKPLAESSDLGIACRKFAQGLSGPGKNSRQKPSLVGLKALFSES